MKQSLSKYLATLLAGAACIAAAPANAQFSRVEDAIKYRQSAFFVMSNQMGRLAAMAQGKAPFDAATAQAAARGGPLPKRQRGRGAGQVASQGVAHLRGGERGREKVTTERLL